MTVFPAVDYRYANGAVDGAGDARVTPPRPPDRRRMVRANEPNFFDHDERTKRRQDQRREREKIRTEQDLPLEKKSIMKDQLARFKHFPSDQEVLSKIRDRPFSARCCSSCCVQSHNKIELGLGSRPLRDLLRVDKIYRKRNFMARNVCLLYHVASRRVVVTPHNVISGVINHQRVSEAVQVAATEEVDCGIDTKGVRFTELLRKHESRARKLLMSMAANASSVLLRLCAWLLLRLLRVPFNSVVFHDGELQLIKEALEKEVSLVFLPLHRSHMDYILLQLFMVLNDIPVPLIAAGDNLDVSIFGSLMRWLGGFFVKRRIDVGASSPRDVVYRSILHTYVEQVLKRNSNLMFFLEGGRSRSGKTLMPKCGLLSVLVQSFQSGVIPDALIVPVGITYDRILDGNFVDEQLGWPKPKESFVHILKSSLTLFTHNVGSCRVSFSQPFSLQEFVSSNVRRQLPPSCLDTPPESLSSPVSRFGSATDVFGERLSLNLTDANRTVIKKLAAHAAYDASRVSAVSATALTAFALLTRFRTGATVEELAGTVSELRREIEAKGRSLAFSGVSEAVVAYGLTMLGPHLVSAKRTEAVEVNDDPSNPADPVTPTVYIPNLRLPFALELLYYANPVVGVFALESAVAIAAVDAFDADLASIWSQRPESVAVEREAILQGALRIVKLLQNEFLFVPPCASVDDAVNSVVESFVTGDVLVSREGDVGGAGDGWRNDRLRKNLNSDIAYDDDDSDDYDDDDNHHYFVARDGNRHLYHMGGSQRLGLGENGAVTISWYASFLAPHLASYGTTVRSLSLLLNSDASQRELVTEVLSRAATRLDHPEAAGADLIRNCLKTLEAMEVVQTYPETEMIGLTDEYCDDAKLKTFVDDVHRFVL